MRNVNVESNIKQPNISQMWHSNNFSRGTAKTNCLQLCTKNKTSSEMFTSSISFGRRCQFDQPRHPRVASVVSVLDYPLAN